MTEPSDPAETSPDSPVAMPSPEQPSDLDPGLPERPGPGTQPDALPPAGLVAKLRASFILDHHVENQGVRREIEWMARHPQLLAARRDRLLEYLPYVCERVWARDMPGELCLLPIVESALDPFALSSDGAVGLWQFIPGTARRFGLKIDWWVDERRDVVLATDAALDYLQELHGLFDDWLLAAAAYNWGEGRVSRELRRVGAGASFFEIRVPRETSRYVDRILAYAAVFANPDAFGIELPLSQDDAVPVSFAVVETGGQLDLARAAEAIGCELEDIYRRNPGLKRWATHPEGPHRLVVDAAHRTTAARALKQIPANERLAWIRHRVAKGDTLSGLAMQHHTTVPTIRRANRLRGTLIRAGDYLLVPSTHRPHADYRLRSPGAPRATGGLYVVKSGDTIWNIARRLGLERKALMAANQISPRDLLQIGRRLAIPN